MDGRIWSSASIINYRGPEELDPAAARALAAELIHAAELIEGR